MNYYVTFCVRDGIKSISQSVNSLLQQTIMPEKIIIVNDGSTDGTKEVLESFKSKYPNLIELIHTFSLTRDYSRIPKLWNIGLRQGYKYHMITAGDVMLTSNYAERILTAMEQDDNLVIASGDYGVKKTIAPLGGGRFVRQDFFYKHYKEYPWIIGYESEILERAISEGCKIKCFNDVELYHLDDLGHAHNFREFGYSMKSLGYYPPYAILRCIKDFVSNQAVGKKGALRILYYYLTFKPQQDGYYSLYPDNVRMKTRNRQKRFLIDTAKMVMVTYPKSTARRIKHEIQH